MAAWLATQGHHVNRKRVQRLMRLLGMAAISMARRSARLSCRAFVPKNHFRPRRVEDTPPSST
jgi:transposase InsO family protein